MTPLSDTYSTKQVKFDNQLKPVPYADLSQKSSTYQDPQPPSVIQHQRLAVESLTESIIKTQMQVGLQGRELDDYESQLESVPGNKHYIS